MLIKKILRQALEEDLGRGDVTSDAIVPRILWEKQVSSAVHGVLAGLPMAQQVLCLVDPNIVFTPLKQDGDRVHKGDVIATVTGNARSILAGERVALNLLQRLSGIATATQEAVEAAKPFNATITDTRKTTPGLRALEKYAVRVGGGKNHRFGLDDGVLIKDNT